MSKLMLTAAKATVIILGVYSLIVISAEHVSEEDLLSEKVSDSTEEKNLPGFQRDASEDQVKNKETMDHTTDNDDNGKYHTSFQKIAKLAFESLFSYKEYLFGLLEELQNLSENNTLKNISVNTSPLSVNSTNIGSITDSNNVDIETNITSGNLTNNKNDSSDASLKKKVVCHPRNTSASNFSLGVKITNSSTLQEQLQTKSEDAGNCFLVMFFAPWCIFSAKTVPVYNALARAFPQIDMYAIDAVYSSSLNARFGTIAVPNILLFHNGRPVSRFNGTERTLENLVSYVANVTGFTATEVNITDADATGPFSNMPSYDTDYLLILSWIFVFTFSSVVVAKSNFGYQLWQRLQHLWQEHQHQHIE